MQILLQYRKITIFFCLRLTFFCAIFVHFQCLFYIPLQEISDQNRWHKRAIKLFGRKKNANVTSQPKFCHISLYRCKAYLPCRFSVSVCVQFMCYMPVTHSCNPNCLALMLGTRLTYKAIQPIKKGDLVTFSYISGFDLWKSTAARRALIRELRFLSLLWINPLHLTMCALDRICLFQQPSLLFIRYL